jgi:hypothetical protein
MVSTASRWQKKSRRLRSGREPVAEQIARDRRDTTIAGLAPAADVVPQPVDQREIVAVLLGEEALLRLADLLALEPIAGWPPLRDAMGHAALVGPVLLRLLVRAVEDRILDRLGGHPIGGRSLVGGLACARHVRPPAS